MADITWRQLFRDILRGFSDKDVASMAAKLDRSPLKPGGMTYVTNAELAALGEVMRRRKQFSVVT